MKPRIEYGSHGPAVSEVQARLNLLMPSAAPPLVVDGRFGSKTAIRVKQFQMSRGLVADGIVGRKTWAALEGAPAPKPGAVPAATNAVKSAKRVPFGARTICSCGSKTSTLRFAATDRTLASTLDSAPFANLGPFGSCHSPYNPMVQTKTFYNQGVFTPQPCVPSFAGMWTPGKPVELVGTPPVAALDANSVIVCIYGGVVTIAEKGK